ncbi:tyrosine-type recombinase/integrase [Corynebacterium propinquum]|uniref:tyrosine-type recombinase/integrase n=1 Tax=Corynebacterium propinquum TaxID=43769 RepID=UPI00223B7E77|nr:site-specific integrase [Corynebacterium propinquum]MCT1819409.1 site-specific integrase [Corynebacterium propinquum]
MASVIAYSTAQGKRWKVKYVKPDGKTTTKRGFAKKAEADRWAAQNTLDMDSGKWVDAKSAKTTVADLSVLWLTGVEKLKPSSQRVVKIAWNKHVEPVWGRRVVRGIKPSQVQAWVNEQAAGATTIRRNHNALAQILDIALKDGLIESNPARGVRLPSKPKGKKVYLTMGEVERLADKSKYPTIVWTLATVGLRWGELAGLQVGDLDLERGRIHVRRNAVTVGHRIELGSLKAGESRVVAVPGFVCEMLRKQARGKLPKAWLFPARDGEPMRLPDSGKWFSSAAQKVGLDVTPHGLRHVAAGLLVSAGANVKVVQRQLGHASAAMTLDVYAELFDDDLDSVAAKLDELRGSDLGQTG